MLAPILFALVSQNPTTLPTPPAGLNEHFYQAVHVVEQHLAKGDFAKAHVASSALPKAEVTVLWDDSAVPEKFRAEFRGARDKALGLWARRITSLKFNLVTKGGDLKFSFAKSLPPQPGSTVPAGAVHFFSDGRAEPRLETVMALVRSEKAIQTEAAEVHNEVSYAVASYLGLGRYPIFGPANSRSDISTTAETILPPGQVTLTRAALDIANTLRKAVAAKEKVAEARKPVVRLDLDKFEAGPIMQGDTIDFAIQANNIGTGTLALRTEPDCGCLSVVPTGQAAAGQTHLIRARFDSAEFVGDVRKRLWITTNDPEQPFIEIPVRVQVVPRFRLLAPEGKVLLMKPGGLETEFFMTLSENARIRPTEVSLDGLPGEVSFSAWKGDLADPDMGEGSKPRNGYRFVVKLEDNVPPGRHLTTVQIATDNARFPVIRHSFLVQRGIVALPLQVYFGEVQGPKRSPFVVSRPGTAFRITKVESSSPRLTVEFPKEPGTDHRLIVQYDGKADVGDLSAMLTVHTDDPNQPSLQVPVRLVAR